MTKQNVLLGDGVCRGESGVISKGGIGMEFYSKKLLPDDSSNSPILK